MRTRNSAESWRAQVLHDEAEQLMVAVMMLANLEGHQAGVREARVAW